MQRLVLCYDGGMKLKVLAACLMIAGCQSQPPTETITEATPQGASPQAFNPAAWPTAIAPATMERYNRLKTGMTYPEVVQIMGCEGHQTTNYQSDTTVGNQTISMDSKSYLWVNRADSFVQISFDHGRVAGMTQLNLPPVGQ